MGPVSWQVNSLKSLASTNDHRQATNLVREDRLKEFEAEYKKFAQRFNSATDQAFERILANDGEGLEVHDAWIAEIEKSRNIYLHPIDYRSESKGVEYTYEVCYLGLDKNIYFLTITENRRVPYTWSCMSLSDMYGSEREKAYWFKDEKNGYFAQGYKLIGKINQIHPPVKGPKHDLLAYLLKGVYSAIRR